MPTPVDSLLANAGRSRSDAERRAMFARMSGGGRSSGVTRSWTEATDAARDRYAAAYHGPSMEQLRKGNEGLDQVQGLMGLFGGVKALGGLLARGPRLARAAQSAAAASLASGVGASAVDDYRERNPTMDPRRERALAKLQALLGTVSALAGLAAAKRAAPKSFSRLDVWAAKASNVAQRAGRRVASRLPPGVRGGLARLKGGYDTLAGITGNELPSLRQIPEAAKLLKQGRALQAAQKLTGPAIVAAGMAAIEVGEQAQIDRYKAGIGAQWDLGQNFDLPADPDPVTDPGSAAANFALGALGNPLEKQLRSYYGGRYTKDLADLAAYELQYDRIGQMERAGLMDAAGAEAAREKLAEWKPWNMAGRSVYSFTPAAANFLKWQASEFGDLLARPIQVGKVTEVFDADTIRIEGGNPRGIRLTGINAPEIDHGPGKPAEYLGVEATQWQTDQLLGKVVRIVQNPEALTEKYGRDLGFVETLPGPLDSLLRIPGLNRILPTVDQNQKTLAEGYAAPKKEHERLPGGKHERLAEYDRTVAGAIAREVGIHSPEGRAQYPWSYTPTRTNAPTVLSRAATLAGLGLMVSGNTGFFRKLGPVGSPAAQTYNAALSGFGTWQHLADGNANTGRVYRLPRGYATGYEIRTDL